MKTYVYLTYEQTLAQSKTMYPHMFFGKDVDSLARVEAQLCKLARCDDLSEVEEYKVYVLLPNIRECLE